MVRVRHVHKWPSLAARPLLWLVATLVIAAGCSSGPGPLSQPQANQTLLIAASLEEIAPRVGGSGTAYVLDHVDAGIVTRMRGDPTFRDSLTNEGPLTGELTRATMDAIQASMAERAVEFVADSSDIPRGGDEVFGCTPFANDAAYVGFAPVPALAVHGGVFFVAVDVSRGCEFRWFAVRLIWVEGQPVGGHWDAVEVIEGPAVAV